MISRKVILILAACAFPLGAGEIPEKAERYRTMLLKKPENPVLFGRMLDAWLEEKELEALKPELELRAKEGSAADWRLLAVFHEHSGDEDAALKALDEAVKLSPDDVAARLARGKALGSALRFDAALEDLAIAAKDKEIGVEAGTLRGKLLARAGRPAEAVKAWQELIAAYPADEGLKEDLIELEIGEGMLDEAVAAARELAEKTEDPYKKALRRLQVAEILAQAGKKDDSLKEYREVFAVSAEGSWLEREVLARAGALFSREDDAGGLKDFLGELRDAYPRRVAVKKEAAKSLLAGGEEDEAVAMFREVLKVMPGDREVRDEFIALLEGAGRHKDAAEEVTALLEAAKDDAVLWERLAVLKKSLADEAGLKEALDKAVALTPDDEAGLVARARLLERFERLDDAEKILRDAVTKHGKAGEAGEALAGFLVAQNKGDEAVAMWKEMAAEADREGLLRIVRSLSAHGKATEAFAMLQPRVKDFPKDPLLLAALCAAAQLGDDPEAAVPQAMELVRQAESPTDLDAALRQATALVARAEDPRKWLDELSNKPDPTIQERCLLAEMHEALGDSIEAEKVLTAAMAGDDTLLAATQRVRLQEMRGNSDAAVAAMREMMALPGGTKTAHVKRLVELLERAGNFDDALAETMNWLKLAPGDKLAWSKRAELFLGEGRPVEAVAELRRALAKFGGDEELRAKLADAMREAGMNEEAWRSYTALYDEAESPASKLKWTASLARMAALEGKEDELVKDFRRRSRDNPSSVVPLLALAEMFKEWGNADEEMKCVAEALRRKPEDGALRFRLADMEEQSGSPEKAEAILRGMLSGSDAPEARRRMAAYWIRQGETERGLREMLDGNKNADPRLIERMIMALVVAKEWEQAAKVLERESGARPEDWRLAYFHAVAVLEAGDKKGAFDKFAALLSADGELKGTTPLTAARGGYGYPGMPVQAAAPPTRLAIPGFRRLQGQAFMHRGERDYYYGGGTPGEVALPGSPQEVRSLALLQALAIAKEDGMDREPMLAKLQSPHLDDLATLKHAYFLGAEDLKAELMKEDADPALFRWQLENQNYDNGQQDSEAMLHGVRIGLAKDPDLALMLTGRVGYGGEKGLPAAEVGQLLDLIGKMEGNKRASALGPLSGIAFSEELPEETRKRAEKLLIDFSKEQKGNNWFIASMPMNWMRQGRFDEAAEWINRTTAENAGKDAWMQNQGMPWQYRMQQMGMSDQPGLAYPAILQEVVPNSYQELSGDANNQRKVSEVETKLLKILGDEPVGGQQRATKPIDREGLAKIAPKLADRALRILFYQAAGKDKEVEREVAEISKSPEATTTELVVAAAHRSSVGKSNVDAFALLSKARELPKAGAWRERIDFELVKFGVQLSAGKTEVADLEAARRAALRMRKSSGFNPEMKTYLADAMNKLGMEEESRRFTAAPAVVMSGRNPYSSMRSGMRPSRGGVNEITKLVRDGKREAAARRMLGEIRKASGNPNSRYELDQLYENAVSLKLADEMAKAGAPSPDSGFNRRKDHALMLIRLGKKEAALPLLRVLAEEKPKEMSIRAALFSALPEEEQKEQLQFVVEGDFDADALSEMFKQWLGERKSERQFEAIGAMTNFLENLKPSFESDRNLSWVNYLVKQFVQYSNLEVEVRPLLGKSNNKNFDEAVSKKRDELAGRIFRAMLKHPQTCEQGFILLYATRERLGVPVEELDKAALAAARASLRLSNGRNPRQGYYYMNSSHYLWAWIRGSGSSTSGNPPEGGQPPSVHLSRRAAEGFAVEVLDDAFLKELAASDPKTSAMMDRCLKVVGGEGAAAFESWAKEAEERKNEMGMELVWIVRLAESRKRPDLLKLAQEHAAKLVLKGDQRQQELVGVLVASVTGAKDAATREAELERVTTLLIGPPEAWPLYARLDQNSYIPGVQYRRQAFQSFVQRLNEDKAAAMAGCRFVVRHGLGKVAQLDQGYLWQILSYQPAIGDLLDSGLLDPGPEPAGSIDQQESESMIGDLVQRLKNQGDRTKKDGEELLKVEGGKRFWARLTGAALTGNTEAAMKEIARDKAVIAKWSGPERERFAKFVASTFPDALAKADGPTRKMLADSMKKGDEESRKLAEGYLKDGFPPNFQPWSVSESITPLVVRLAGEDVALAVKLWSKAIEACRARANTGWNSSSNGFQRSPESYVHGQLLDQFLQRKTPLPVFCGFLAEFSKQDAARFVGGAEGNFRYNLDSRFSAEATRLKDAIAKDKIVSGLNQSVRSLAGVRALLGKEMPKEARPVFAALSLHELLYNPSDTKATRERALAWAKNELKKIDPALSQSTVLALLANDASNLDDAAKKELREAFVAFASDKSIPVDWRFTALLPLFDKDEVVSLLDDPACAKAMAGLLSDHVTPERHWVGREAVQLVSRFAAWRSTAPDDARSILGQVAASRISYSNGIDNDVARASVGTMTLDLALRGGDAAEIAKAVQGGGAAVKGRIDLAVKLWQHRLGPQAVSLIARPGELHQGARSLFFENKEAPVDPPKFTREMEQALPEWLKGIEDPAQRFRVECLISSFKDAEGEAAPQVKQEPRLEALMKRFAAEGPKPRAARMETLAALCTAALQARVLEPEILPMIKGADFGTLLVTRGNGGSGANAADLNETYVLECLIRRAMRYPLERDGDATMFATQVEALTTAGIGNLKWSVRSTMSNFFNWYAALTIRRIAEVPQTERAAIAANVRKISGDVLAFADPSNHYYTVGFLIAAHALSGEGTAMDKWLAELPEGSGKAYEEARKSHGLRTALSNLKQWPLTGDEFKASRLLVLTALLTEPATVAREIKHPTELSSIMDSGLFSQEELFEVIDGLPADHPQKAKFLAEKAGIIGWRTDEKDEAIKNYDAADAAAKASGDAKSIAYARAYRAAYLENRQGKLAEAAAIAKEINPDDLEEKERKWMEDLMKKAAGKK